MAIPPVSGTGKPRFESEISDHQGVAQLVARQPGGLEVAGSCPATLTKEREPFGKGTRLLPEQRAQVLAVFDSQALRRADLDPEGTARCEWSRPRCHLPGKPTTRPPRFALDQCSRLSQPGNGRASIGL